MIIKKHKGRGYGVTLTSNERRAMNAEIQNQLAEYTEKHSTEVMAMFLWYLHEEFGFGKKRLARVLNTFSLRITELCDRYKMNLPGDDVWLCKHKLREYGIDVENWNDEEGD